jgi:hypothetical protein
MKAEKRCQDFFQHYLEINLNRQGARMAASIDQRIADDQINFARLGGRAYRI